MNTFFHWMRKKLFKLFQNVEQQSSAGFGSNVHRAKNHNSQCSFILGHHQETHQCCYQSIELYRSTIQNSSQTWSCSEIQYQWCIIFISCSNTTQSEIKQENSILGSKRNTQIILCIQRETSWLNTRQKDDSSKILNLFNTLNFIAWTMTDMNCSSEGMKFSAELQIKRVFSR